MLLTVGKFAFEVITMLTFQVGIDTTETLDVIDKAFLFIEILMLRGHLKTGRVKANSSDL